MGKLVQCVELNLPNIMPNKMYCYGEANIELHDLKTDNVEEAKHKALKIVENYLNDLIEKVSRQCEIIKSQ